MLNECGHFVFVWCKIGVLWSSKGFLTRAARVLVRLWPSSRMFFKPPTLTGCNFATLLPKETHNTSFERSNSFCQLTFHSRYFLLDQSTPILHHTETNCPHSFSITVHTVSSDTIFLVLYPQSEYFLVMNDLKVDFFFTTFLSCNST